MKYEVTQEDKDIMERDMQSDRTLKHLRNMSFYKFSIGDVLIREERYRNYDKVHGAADGYEWKPVKASCGLHNKYVYVFENELGVGYIRRMSVNGSRLVDQPLCITQFDPDQTRFQLDPEYADHMLLASEEDEFDVKTRYSNLKKKRERINRLNEKIRLKWADEPAVIAWMQTLKVGDQLWWGYGKNSIHKEPYVVLEVSKNTTGSWYSNSWFLKMAPANNPNAYPSNVWSNGISSQCFFTTRPTFADEVLD
jgi:hypothetical protein